MDSTEEQGFVSVNVADASHQGLIEQGIFDSAGTLIEIQSTGRNITDRKQAEAALRKRETQLRLALEAGKITCWESDLETQQITCIGRHEPNNQWQFETWQSTYRDAQAQIHPDDRERVSQKLLFAQSWACCLCEQMQNGFSTWGQDILFVCQRLHALNALSSSFWMRAC